MTPSLPRTQQPSYPSYKIYGTNCSWPTGTFGDEVRDLAEELQQQGTGSLRAHLAHIEAAETTSLDDKLRVALALRRSRHGHELRNAIEDFARRMVGKHPAHAGVALLVADIEAVAGEWAEVGRLLARADPADLDAPRARHFRHVEGLAHFHGGRLNEAHRAFRLGAELEGHCALEPLITLAKPMADPPNAADWAPDQPKIRRLVGAIRIAERALAAGNAVIARAALDRRDLRWQHEMQSAARRAVAYLEGPAAEVFDERTALAFYVQLRQEDEIYIRHDLFLPGTSWDEERLAEVEERASARLDEL